MSVTLLGRGGALALAFFAAMAGGCAADEGDAAKSLQGSASSGSSNTANAGSGSPYASGSSPGAGVPSGATGSVATAGSTAGSGAGSGSSGGAFTGAASGSVDGGIAPTTGGALTPPPPATSIEVDYFANSPNQTNTNQIQCNLEVVNRAVAAGVSLADVTVRYWFTRDGNALASLYFQSYYAQNLTTSADVTKDVNAVFVAVPTGNATATADTYVEISFGAAAGELPLGEGATVQVDIRGPGAGSYTDMFIQTNDYSFDPTKTAFQPSATVTGYLGGQLVWGVEPAAAADAATDGGAVRDATLGSDDATAADAGPSDDASQPVAGDDAGPDTGASDAGIDPTDGAGENAPPVTEDAALAGDAAADAATE